jgi:nitrile hydratase
VEREGRPQAGKELFNALYQIVLDKGLVSRDEIRAMVEGLDTAGKKLNGATLIIKAWMDAEFKKRECSSKKKWLLNV